MTSQITTSLPMPVDLNGDDVGWSDALEEQFGAIPWWVVSFVIHTILMMGALLIIIGRVDLELPADDVIVLKWPKIIETITPPDVLKPTNIDTVLVVEREKEDILTEKLEKDTTTTENVEDLLKPRGTDSISDIPVTEDSKATISFFGVGPNGGPSGARGGPFGQRFRDKAGVGSPQGRLDPQVFLALKWLAAHQEGDGSWDPVKWDKLPEGHEGKTPTSRSGVTGLALLAFLGVGSTSKRGQYSNVVKKGLAWLVAQQNKDGAIGHNGPHVAHDGSGYNHAICGLVLAEAYGMGDKQFEKAAQLAVDYSVSKHIHQTADGYSAWRYDAGMKPDTSVTGWFIMQLKSAKVAGLKVPGSAFMGAKNFLDTVTSMQGTNIGQAAYQPGKSLSRTMTAVAFSSRIFLGHTKDDPLITGGASLLARNLPEWDNPGDVDFYYWYYGTLGMYHMQDADWNKWIDALASALTDRQRVDGDFSTFKGSWDPTGPWCYSGGRVYSTAMGALCLEVFYRYVPQFAK